MVSEKHKVDEEALVPKGLPPATTDRRRSAKLQRRVMIAVLGLFTLWSAVSTIDAVQDWWKVPRSVLPDVLDNSPASSYLNRLTGVGEPSGLLKHHKDKDHKHKGKKHGHHGKHDKHDKHGKHGHHHEPDHPHPHPPHHPPHPPHDPHHPHPHPHPPPPPHHPPHRWISPKEAEDIFLSVPNNDSIRADARKYTATPHPAGSGFDYITALQVKSQWERSLGLPTSGSDENIYEAGSSESQARVYNGMDKLGVWIDTYYPVMNTPVSASVTLLTDPPIKAKLREDIVQGDPDSVYRDDVPVFHGLSVSGDVTGQVVYAGYGRKRDFEALSAKGIDLTGKIALVKYGGNFRGLKIKAAQEAGAVGCLIFTDPGDDGEITEEHGYAQYPDGPARQQSSVQRGSVQFISVYPGDPSTPGEPAYKNATRAESSNQPSIPSLPISYEDAIPILNGLKGHGTPAAEISDDWVGGLGFYGVEYFTGPSEVELHFVNEVNTRVMPIWNTMAVIPGHITDEVVVIGNHRDAWVLGAGDPNSGTAAHNEMVRGFGKLLSKGWKPLRTIVLASWDAEEYGLIGSTEWTEDFGEWLKVNNAVYLNVDVAVAGPNFKSAASPSLAWLIRRAAEQIQSHPDGTSVWDTRVNEDDWKSWRIQDDEFEVSSENQSETGVKALGSGSDYTSFLQRYGVASGDIGYTYGPKSAVYHYHSIYDSFTWQEKYGDPGFHRHVDAAKILGLLSLRAADSLVLPLNTTQYAIELKYYLAKVQDIAESSQLQLEGSLNLTNLADAIHELEAASLVLDNKTLADMGKLHKLLPPPPHGDHGHDHPHHDCPKKQMKQFLLKICSAMGSSRCERKLKKDHSQHQPHHGHEGGPPRLPKKKVAEIKKVLESIRAGNKKRQAFEGGFISEEGIKEREWYKHKVTAPGLWLGYGATTFPAITEALTIDKSIELAQKEADELAEMINVMADRLRA